MSCVVSPAKSAACCFVVLLFGALMVVGMTAGAAHANDAYATPANSWCIARSDAQPNCAYDNAVTCGINAIFTGGHCVKAEPSVMPTATANAVPSPQRRKLPRRKPPAAQNDELFQEFVRWQQTAPK